MTSFDRNISIAEPFAFGASFLALLLSGCSGGLSESGQERKAAAQELKRAFGGTGSSSGEGRALVANSPAEAREVPPAIAAFCGDCHKLPQPTSFPQDVWYEEIKKGYEFYARSGRTDLDPPPPEEVTRYYRSQAPKEMVFPPVGSLSDQWAGRFTLTKMDWKDGAYLPPAISSLQWLSIDMGANTTQQHLFATDMRDGSISLITPARDNSARAVVGRLSNPARVSPCDYDSDGLTDLIVSDLGSFNPYDHPYGGVALLKQTEDRQFRTELVKNRLGRVADAIVADFQDDERQEVVFAEFGHREKGGLHLLKAKESDGKVALVDRLLDSRPGVVRVIADDMNQDGKLDFVTLTTQEYESVDVWLNSGRGFDRYPVWSAPDLACGSVSMVLEDMDGDGDRDIVVTCGDTFDNNYASLNHGVYLLTNAGEMRFTSQRLLLLPGAYQVIPCDLDSDGDMDIVAVANLPTTIKPLHLRSRDADSVVLLEQTGSAEFVPHVLMQGPARFSCVTAGDFDSDGKVDLAVGVQLFGTDRPQSPASKLPRIQILWQD